MNNIKHIQRLVREELSEVQYKALVYIEYSSDENITEILDQLRAVCGITVINSESADSVSAIKNKATLKVKFFLTSPSLNEHLRGMIAGALELPGVFSFRVKKVKKDKER